MPKVILKFTDNETARKVFNMLTDLKAFRCGLRAIAAHIRTLMQGCTIERDDNDK